MRCKPPAPLKNCNTQIRNSFHSGTNIVILSSTRTNHPSLYRKIESIADLLTEELLREGNLADVYEYFEDATDFPAVS